MKTKIIATIGPSSKDPDILSQLITAGVRIFRLNFSHGDASSFKELISTIRNLEKSLDCSITILQDLSGPKIRIGNLLDDKSLSVTKGDILRLGPSGNTNTDYPYIPFDHKAVLNELEPSDTLLLADGTLQFHVEKKCPDGTFLLSAQGNGIVTSRKGLALPGKSIKMPAITEKDKQDLIEGLKLGVDAVAISYVQTPQDIIDAKKIIHEQGYAVPVVAKLERRNAVDALEDILKEVDIIMVARGDLGIECPLPELPALQKRIIKACNNASKPVIVATQMLLSMVSHPTPTRAETTDVANAVLDGADCVMLSEETAMGNYPVETVSYMRDITTKAEEFMVEHFQLKEPNIDKNTPEFLAYAACLLANKAHAEAIVTHTISGTSARNVAHYRPNQNVYAITTQQTTLKTLNFSWGVYPKYLEANPESHLSRTEQFIMSSTLFSAGSDIIITAGQPTTNTEYPRGTNLVKIYRK